MKIAPAPSGSGNPPVKDLQHSIATAAWSPDIHSGSTRRVPINIRILAATNRDLEHAVMQGSFRRDLYFRLNVLNLRIPALRERRQDIPLLIGHFLERMTRADSPWCRGRRPLDCLRNVPRSD